jgi:hypothetical protein
VSAFNSLKKGAEENAWRFVRDKNQEITSRRASLI